MFPPDGSAGADCLMPFDGYNDVWRRRRKEFHTNFSPTAIARYHPEQEMSAQRLLHRLLIAPEAYADHVHL